MQQLILISHVFIAIALVVLVLLQQGKGADASIGGGASQTFFGSQGSASFLFKLTAVLALLFFATSLLLTRLAAHQPAPTQILQKEWLPSDAPVTPATSNPLPKSDLSKTLKK